MTSKASGILDGLVRSSPAHSVLSAVIGGEVGGHAFLLDAASLAIARHFARHLALGLACRAAGTRPCGQCASCRTPALGHVREILPMGVEFRIQQIHQILSECSLALEPGARRVYVLSGVEAMNEESANSFLKVLEEPPPAVVFILATASRQQVLATIRSRCHAVHVDFPPAVTLTDDALARSPVPAPWLLALLETWGRAPRLLEQAAASGPELRPFSGQQPADEVEALAGHYKKRPAALLADPSDGILCELPHALDTTAFFLGSIGRVLAALNPVTALQEAGRILGWAEELKDAVGKGLHGVEAEMQKTYGDHYVHPLLEEDSYEKSFYRRVTLTALEAFLRSSLLIGRLVAARGTGDRESGMLDQLARDVPGLEASRRLGAPWSRRLLRGVEATRTRLYSNVSPKYALEAFLLGTGKA